MPSYQWAIPRQSKTHEQHQWKQNNCMTFHTISLLCLYTDSVLYSPVSRNHKRWAIASSIRSEDWRIPLFFQSGHHWAICGANSCRVVCPEQRAVQEWPTGTSHTTINQICDGARSATLEHWIFVARGKNQSNSPDFARMNELMFENHSFPSPVPRGIYRSECDHEHLTLGD